MVCVYFLAPEPRAPEGWGRASLRGRDRRRLGQVWCPQISLFCCAEAINLPGRARLKTKVLERGGYQRRRSNPSPPGQPRKPAPRPAFGRPALSTRPVRPWCRVGFQAQCGTAWPPVRTGDRPGFPLRRFLPESRRGLAPVLRPWGQTSFYFSRRAWQIRGSIQKLGANARIPWALGAGGGVNVVKFQCSSFIPAELARSVSTLALRGHTGAQEV